MAGALEGDIFIGPKAEEYRGLLNIKYPMEHGIVTDWNDMERIWQYIYSKEQLQTYAEEVSMHQFPFTRGRPLLLLLLIENGGQALLELHMSTGYFELSNH